MNVTRRPNSQFIKGLDVPQLIQLQLIDTVNRYCRLEGDIKNYLQGMIRDCERVIDDINHGHRTSDNFISERRIKEACAERQATADKIVDLIFTIAAFTDNTVAIEFSQLILTEKEA